MVDWKTNAIMYWHDGTSFKKITDHNRQPLDVSVERIENSSRMIDGTLRRQVIAKKKSWSTSWDMLPSASDRGGLLTVDGGYGGEQIEAFHNDHDDAFQMQLREGDGSIEVVTVMITDFSKSVQKRGKNDFWAITITLSEV